MSRRERLYHLHDLLRQRRTPIGRQELMEELDCSQATLYRMVAELRDKLGAPLERIRDMALLADDSLDLPTDQISRHFDQAFGIFSGPAEDIDKLRFNAEAARWSADEVWHPEQKGRWLDDGRWELELPLGHQRELLMNILSYGGDVEVLAPDSLRSATISALDQARAIYSDAGL